MTCPCRGENARCAACLGRGTLGEQSDDFADVSPGVELAELIAAERRPTSREVVLEAEVARLRAAIKEHSECSFECPTCGRSTPCADDDVVLALGDAP